MTSVDVRTHDLRLEREQAGIARVDDRLHPMGVPRSEGLHAGEVGDHAALVGIEGLVLLVVVRVAVDQRHLPGKASVAAFRAAM